MPRPRSRHSSAARPASPEFRSARWLALQALRGFAQRGAFLARILDDYFDSLRLDPRERRLATELAHETLRRQLTIDTLLAAYVSRPRETVDPALWTVLQLGCCQLLCLPRIPVHAALHETVALCDPLRQSQAKGFVNGVLRTLSRELRIEPAPAGPAAAWAALSDRAALPLLSLADGAAELKLACFPRPVFADFAAAPLRRIAQVASLPEWLLARWAPPAAASAESLRPLLDVGLYFTTQGRIALRVNPLRSTRDDVLAALRAAGIDAVAGELPDAIRAAGSVPLAELPAFRDGALSVQDESAMSVVDLLAPQPGENILDMCSAPGGKSCHIAERLAGTGSVIACDLSQDRLQRVAENVARLQLNNVHAQVVATNADFPPGPFDAVLLDAPCSNTGVLGKRPEARWRLTSRSFAELTAMQRDLLAAAVTRTRPGGRLVYATCSIDREENEDLIAQALAEHPQLELIAERRHTPGEPSDGGYAALLRRAGG